MLVSFIIPAYNAEKTIRKCLDSVMKQKVKKEVIVVDNASSDRTAELVKKRKVRYILENNVGEPYARNRGLDNAKGDYIAFVDSDVVLPDDWTSRALSILKSDRKAGGVGGLGKSAEGGLVSRVIGSRIYGLDESVKRRYVDSIATMNLLLRRKAIQGLRYDESMVLGVDTEFNFRVRKRGYMLLFDRSLFVYHHHPTTIGGLARKWYRYGKNYPYFCTKHREFRKAGFFARIMYMPLLIITGVASLAYAPLALIPASLVLALFAFYAYVGLKAGKGMDKLAFPFIHTLKQLSQLLGTMAGLRRMF